MKKGAIPAIITIGSTIVVSLISYTFVTLKVDVDKMEVEQSTQVKTIASLQADNVTMKEWLTRVEGKLDRAITK